jgi:hypothetical protein
MAAMTSPGNAAKAATMARSIIGTIELPTSVFHSPMKKSMIIRPRLISACPTICGNRWNQPMIPNTIECESSFSFSISALLISKMMIPRA